MAKNKEKLKKILSAISNSDDIKIKNTLKKTISRIKEATEAKTLETAQQKMTEIKNQIQSLFEYIDNLKAELKKSEEKKSLQLKSMMTEYKSASLERLGTLSAEMDQAKKDIEEISQRKIEIPNFESQIKKIENKLKNHNLDDTKKKFSDLEEEISKLRREAMSAIGRGGNMNRNILVANNPSTLGRYADLNILAGSAIGLSYVNNDILKTTDLTISSPTATAITIGTTSIIGGSDTQVQFNNAGVLGSDAGFTYNKTTGALTLVGSLTVPTIYGSTASGGILTLSSTSHTTKGNILFGTSAYDEVNNRLGINTTTPSAPLHVNTGAALSASFLSGNDSAIFAGGTTSGFVTIAFATDNTSGGALRGIKSRGTLDAPTAVVADDRTFVFLGAGHDGTSGIHTALIDFRVDGAVSTGIVPQRIEFITGTTVANRLARLTVKSNGFIGIGTTAPASLLDVANATGGILTLRRVDNTVTANDMVGKLQFYAADTSSTTNFIVADIEAQATNTITTDINPGRLIFRTTSTTVAATPTERMRIDESGNIGIGATSFGTSAAGVLAIASGTAPTTSPADMTQLWVQDTVAGQANLYTRNENGKSEQITGLKYRVSTQFDKTDATLAAITGLSHNVEAGKSYAFKAFLFYDADAIGGHKYSIAGTATATAIRYHIRSLSDATSAYVITARQTALAGAGSGQAGSTAGLTIIEGTITVNAAGTLTPMFAQNAANGTSSILVGSYFELIPIGD